MNDNGLNDNLSEITVHGSLIDLNGRGILVLGESGIGKTTVCMELAERGCRFVSDDAVKIKTVNGRLVGSSPDRTRGLMAVRDKTIQLMPDLSNCLGDITLYFAVRIIEKKEIVGDLVEILGHQLHLYAVERKDPKIMADEIKAIVEPGEHQ